MELTSSFLIAQGFGVAALLAYIISTQVDTRRSVLIWRTVYSGVYAIQYILLGAFSGCVSSLVPIVRNLAYTRYDNKKEVPTYLIVIFSALVIIAGLIFYDGPLSLLSVAHTVFCTIFIAQKSLTLFRFTQAFSAILMLVYNLYVGAYVGVLLVIIQFISMVIGIIRFDSEKIKSLIFKTKKVKKTKKKSRH